MTPPDPTAVREAADYRREYLKDRQHSAVAWQTQGDSILADAYLALTDPAPLTVEVLVGMGGKLIPVVHQVVTGDVCVVFDKFRVTIYANGTWEWDEGEDWRPIHHAPRTAGHLAMLLAMMEGR